MIPRLRLFAGPNGAGKTSLSLGLSKRFHLGYGEYINPDEIALDLMRQRTDFDEESAFREAQKEALKRRESALHEKRSLTYESVMSHSSHLDFMLQAALGGYRNYLYYIGVKNPGICQRRVLARVSRGTGHRVPEEKIAPRYERSLTQLPAMCRLVRRAFLFDNSGDKHVFIAEVTPEQDLKLFRGEINSVGGAAWLVRSLVANWPEEKVRWEG